MVPSWWLGQAVLGISRMFLLNIRAIQPSAKIKSDRAFRRRFEINPWKRASQKLSEASFRKTPPR
jgi:hypothetical protein